MEKNQNSNVLYIQTIKSNFKIRDNLFNQRNPWAKNMKLFITGISTDVGKTIASSIIVEALEADCWKRIQTGDVESR